MNANNVLAKLGSYFSNSVYKNVGRLFTIMISSGIIVFFVGGCVSTQYRYGTRVMPFSELSQDPEIIRLVKTMDHKEAIEVIRASYEAIGLYHDVVATKHDVSWTAVNPITIHDDLQSRTTAYVLYRVVIFFDSIQMVEVKEMKQVAVPGDIETIYGWTFDLHLSGVPKERIITHHASGAQSTIIQNPANIKFYHGLFPRGLTHVVKLESGDLFSYKTISNTFPIDEARGMRDRFLAALLVLRPDIPTYDRAGIE